jgi:excisionase family DNA binding protein
MTDHDGLRNPGPRRLQTTAEVGDALRVSAKTVRRYVSAGLLPAVRVQRRLLIPSDAVARLLARSGEGV